MALQIEQEGAELKNMVECELEKDRKFVTWIAEQVGLADYKALPVEVRRGWREQYRRDHGILTSAMLLAKMLKR